MSQKFGSTLTLLLCFALTLAACGRGQPTPTPTAVAPAAADAEATAVPTSAPADEPDPEPEPTESPVEAAGDEAATDFAGVYTAELPSASSPGRVLSLTLAVDGSVTFATDYLNDEPPIVEVGEWAANEDGTATVTLTGQAERAYDEPVLIVFALDGATLTAVEYDQSLYGAEGLTLEKELEAVTADLVGSWQLVRIAYSDDTEVVPDDPTHYTFEFMADGGLAIRNDCNRGMGTYKSDGVSLALSPVAFTRMACPPGSLFNEVAQNLEIVASYLIEDEMLYIALAMDVGIMELARID